MSNDMETDSSEGSSVAVNEYPDPDDDVASFFPWTGSRETVHRPQPFVNTTPQIVRSIERVKEDNTVYDEAHYSLRSQGGKSVVQRLAEDDSDYQVQGSTSGDESIASDYDVQEYSDGDVPTQTLSHLLSEVSRSGTPGDAAAEGRGRGRGSDRRRGRPRGSRGGLSKLLKLGAPPAPRSRGRGRGRQGGRRGARRGMVRPLPPSDQFHRLQQEATDAYLSKDYERAEEFAQEAIQCNPEMFTAYSLLSEIYKATGDDQRANMILSFGAHTRHRDRDAWMRQARAALNSSNGERHRAIKDALYYYAQVIGTHPNETEARYERAALYTEIGRHDRAYADYAKLLEFCPDDLTLLRYFAITCIDTKKGFIAIDAYDRTISRLQLTDQVEEMAFSWSDANVYAELFLLAERYESGLSKIKSVARWLLSRAAETYWDHFTEDDREFDLEDDPRRSEVPEYSKQEYPSDTYGQGLPMELRIKLGVCRLNMGDEHFDEALFHFEQLEPDNTGPKAKVYDYPDLFKETGDALRSQGFYDEALKFYDPIQRCPDFADSLLFVNLASCYRGMEMYDVAEECYRFAIEQDPENSTLHVEVATMFEEAGRSDRAKPYIDNLFEIRRRKLVPADNTAQSIEQADLEKDVMTLLSEAKPKKPARARPAIKQRRRITSEEEKDIPVIFHAAERMLSSLEAGIVEERANFKVAAASLLTKFKTKTVFFPIDRHVRFLGYSKNSRQKALHSKQKQAQYATQKAEGTLNLTDEELREELEVPSQYCGISFNEWLDLFLHYAWCISEDGEKSECYHILDFIKRANIWYHDPQSSFLIHSVYLVCALRFDDHETICNVSRYFMNVHQFETDSYRLFAALNRLASTPNLWYNSGPTQKFILRQIKAVDFAIIGQTETKSLWQERASYKLDENGNPIVPKSMDIMLLYVYGHILYAAASYPQALNYFWRAYALDPTNAMIHLSIGLSYTQYALKRQADNRQHLLASGFTFLFMYYEGRKLSNIPSERQEAEFNLGRVYHMLGLTHLAVPFYKSCLELDVEVRKTENGHTAENFATEAALCLQAIWAIAGQAGEAKAVTEAWLAV